MPKKTPQQQQQKRIPTFPPLPKGRTSERLAQKDTSKFRALVRDESIDDDLDESWHGSDSDFSPDEVEASDESYLVHNMESADSDLSRGVYGSPQIASNRSRRDRVRPRVFRDESAWSFTGPGFQKEDRKRWEISF